MWKCNRCGASTPKTCTCPKAGDATPPATPQPETPALPPVGDMDAVKWAKSFVAHVAAHTEIATDEGTMIGWFANAIMAGYDTAQGRKIATLTQERDEARAKEAATFHELAGQRLAWAMAKVDKEAAEARCATLTAALEQKTKWADFLGDYLDGNHESHGSDRAWDEFIEKEHETPPVTGCECAQCRAALAAAPQGGTHK